MNRRGGDIAHDTSRALVVREFKNNLTVRANIMKHLEDAISPLVDIPTKHSSLYNMQDFNRGMMRAVCADSSVGGCAFGVSAGNYARISPSDEWVWRLLATMYTDNVQKMFKESVAK